MAAEALSFWDSLPDAAVSAAPSQQAEVSPSVGNKAGSANGFWDSLPDAPPMPPEPPSISSDIGKGLASGAAQGFLDLPNAPKHLAQLMAQSVTRPAGAAYDYLADKMGLPGLSPGAAEWMTYPIENPNQPTAGDVMTKRVIPGAVKAATNMDINYQPETKAGEYTQSVGRMMPFAADPETGIVRAAGMGGGAQLGKDIVGLFTDNPEAQEVGSLGFSVLGGGAKGAASAAIKPAYNAAKDFADNAGFGKKVMALSPDIQATQGQVNQAISNVRGAANNPEALLPSIEKNAGEIVPGSKPTMAEMSPDHGLAQYQDAMRTNNPTPFSERARDQNTARAQGITGVRGAGNPDSLGEYFANRLIDEDNALQGKEQGAQQAASSKGMNLGRYGELPAEGATADALQNAQGVRKEAASEAWKILDPYKNSAADLETLRQAAAGIHKEASQYGAQALEPAVTRITQDALRPPDPRTDNLGALQRFRSNISDAQREVKAGSQSMRYLQMLKNGVDKGIENTVNGLVTEEQRAVAMGELSPEQTLHSLLLDEINSFQANQNAFKQVVSRTGSGRGSSESTGSRPQTVSSSGSPTSNQERGLGAPQRMESSLGENANSKELNSAIDNWEGLKELERHLTTTINTKSSLSGKQGGIWRRKTITEIADDAKGLDNVKKQIIDAEKRISEIESDEAAVKPPAFGAEQKQQYESARSLTFRHETLSRLENSGAVNPDGTLDAAKYDRWYQKNKSLFKSNKEFGEQLGDWRKAQEHLNDVRAERVAHQKEFQNSRAAALISNDPVNEIGRIFGSKTKDPVKEFTSLIDKVKGDKDATEGLKAAVADHILNKVGKVETEEVDGKTVGRVREQQSYRDFIKQHRESLKAIYGNQLQDLENVAADIKRTQEYNARAKIPGQSNTTKDAIQAAKQKGNSVFGRVLKSLPMVGGLIGLASGHAGAGLGGGIGASMVNSLLSGGMKTVNAIELEMMLHPSTFGKAMLENIPTKEIPLPIQKRIASSIIKTLPGAGAGVPDSKRQDKPKDE